MTIANPVNPVPLTVDACQAARRLPEFKPGEEYVIDVKTLHGMLSRENLRIVDVRQLAQCPDGHIPGAVQLDYGRLVLQVEGGARGLLPPAAEVSTLLGELGISPDDFVVAYDDGHGVEAARLLWTLDVVGHENYALLNGGFAAWDDAELEVSDHPHSPRARCYPVVEYGPALVEKEQVLEVITDPRVQLVDTRSAAEFEGRDLRAARGGRIPGAVNYNWESAIDLFEEGALREEGEIRRELESLGVTPDRRIIVYCQSNRRSSHTFVVLKWLGFEDVRAYAGSWSEWGNSEHLPLETSA